MSHITGTVQVLPTPQIIGPGPTIFNPAVAPGGTKLLMLHFQNLNFLPGDHLEVNLGYGIDTFTSADGPDFWTRPINVYAFPAGVQITYVAAGPPTGSVQLDRFGRGERHVGQAGHPSFSNCDPFYQPPAYLEPTYDPFWYCVDPPNWENAPCATPAADVRAQILRSVGMIVSVEDAILSTCSVTLVDTDKVITAGHCHTPEQALTSSIIFNYQTQCDGTQPPGYSPRFFKVKAVLAHHFDGVGDFSLLQLSEAPAGIPPIQMRHDLPGVGEQVFGVHHPNGAVKKLSLPHGEGFATVQSSGSGSITVPTNFHVSGGSSGSGLFDTAGRITGVLSNGNPCVGGLLSYFPTATILTAIAPAPPPPITRDVMVVFDRSGSMSMDDGFGRQKIQAARDAVSLFVQLIRAGTGNRLGLVSFSTTASVPFAIADVTVANKNALIGPPPFTGGVVAGLTPGGMTTIGGGLDAGRAQFPVQLTNPRAILLMTDGLQNTPPMVADIEPALGTITVHAIGFGAASSLDGALLSALATAHGGLYTRAEGGLQLEKFFSTAFGNIFEAGILMDPEFNLPADQESGTPVPFLVCAEENITAVAGWDREDASLELELTTPGGAVITAATPGVESSTGNTWTFLRLSLPFGAERNGQWKVNVRRPGIIIPAAAKAAAPAVGPALRYFLNVIPTGGPRLSRRPDTNRYYTGDHINPMVMVRYDNGGWPDDIKVTLTITRPEAGEGNILSLSGLGGPGTIDADAIPPRQAALQSIEASTGKPAIPYSQITVDLGSDSINTEGLFEDAGMLGKPFDELLDMEGDYTFYAKATYGDGDCHGARELTWSVRVDVGIDPGRTTVTTAPLPPRPDGGPCSRLTFTPRDRYGNLIGPGRADSFTVQPEPGTSMSGGVTDLGNGSYQVDVCTDPNTIEPPKISIGQPGRPPVVIVPPVRIFIYSVKYVCGVQKDDCCGCAPVRPGRYATEINIHNPGEKEVLVGKRVIPLVTAGAASGREPKFNGPAGTPEIVKLPAHSATMDDCCRIAEMQLGAEPAGEIGLSIGILEVLSTAEVAVTAVYTATDGHGGAPAIEVNKIQPRVLI
jgi:hypothetical protein